MTRRKPLIGASCIASCVIVLPAFAAMHAWPSVVTALAVVCVLIGLMTLSSPAGFVLILETLHPQVWTTSPGVIYALGA